MNAHTFFKGAATLAAALVLCSCDAFASLMATATFTATQATPGTYTYNFTLNDIGTTPIGTFWFSWVPGAGFLSPVPTNIQSPAGWTSRATNAGAGIQWTTTTNLLGAGSSLSGFSFMSTETPAQLVALTTSGAFTQPGSVFYVYQGAPLAPGDPGFQAVATAATPEPSAFLLTFTGMGSGLALLKRRKLAQAVLCRLPLRS